MGKKKHFTKFLWILLLFLLLLTGVLSLYLGTYYRASEKACAIAETADEELTIGRRKVLLFRRTETIQADTPALIFYPGGKVDPEAYAPLCRKLADRGIVCALVKMPFNLAVFDTSAAKPIIEYLSDTIGIHNVYLGGHSLGGAMACEYVYSHSEEVNGLFLLAAYSAKNLSQTDLSVLSVYGTKDGVMNRDKYREYMAYMPGYFTEKQISGGCHSYFGDYGMQKGDGTPTISRNEQLTITADTLADWVLQDCSVSFPDAAAS